MTWISKHNKDNYYDNKVVGMVGLFLLLLLAGSAGAWIWSCRSIGILFFSSTIFFTLFEIQKMLPYEQKDLVHFESQVWIISGTGETSTLMSSWWRAGILRAKIIFILISSLINVDKFDHFAPSYGNEFLARGNMAHRTLPKVISILLLDCLLVIWSYWKPHMKIILSFDLQASVTRSKW